MAAQLLVHVAQQNMYTPKLVFDAGGIGTTTKSITFTRDTPEAVSSLLHKLQCLCIGQLDDGASDPPTNPWNTETLLGQVNVGERGFILDSKNIIHEIIALLDVLRVNILYSHLRDASTPIEETAAAFHKQFIAGKFQKVNIPHSLPLINLTDTRSQLGVSNYSQSKLSLSLMHASAEAT